VVGPRLTHNWWMGGFRSVVAGPLVSGLA